MSGAVVRVIDLMWERYGEPLSLAELADEALFSRFYFSRIFRSETGTSPGRFLTAIRLFRAKNLLLETALSVTDISYLVGYNSPGTFSSRFTLSVGMPPARYRQLAKAGFRVPPRRLIRGGASSAVEFTALLPTTGVPSQSYVGVFGTPYPSMPVACSVFPDSGRYLIPNVPDGDWAIRTVTVATTALDARPWHRRPLLVSEPVAIKVRAGSAVPCAWLVPRQPRRTDLPVLLAIPELDSFRVPRWQVERPADHG